MNTRSKLLVALATASVLVVGGSAAAQQANRNACPMMEGGSDSSRGMMPGMMGDGVMPMMRMMHMMEMMGGMSGRMDMAAGCPMMAANIEGPNAALRLRDSLGLTAEQVRKLDGAKQALAEARRDAMTRMIAAMQTARHQLTAPNSAYREKELRDAYARMAGAHPDLAVAVVQARRQTQGVLTETQRTKLADLTGRGMDMMSMMMWMMKGDMMSHCPVGAHGTDRREDL